MANQYQSPLGSSLTDPGTGNSYQTVYDAYLTTVAATSTLNLNPAKGSLVFTGHAPTHTVSDNHLSTPAKGALTFTGHAPTLTLSTRLDLLPGKGHLSFTGYAPYTVKNINPGKGHLTFTGHAPSSVKNINPATGHLTFAGLNPTISGSVLQSHQGKASAQAGFSVYKTYDAKATAQAGFNTYVTYNGKADAQAGFNAYATTNTKVTAQSGFSVYRPYSAKVTAQSSLSAYSAYNAHVTSQAGFNAYVAYTAKATAQAGFLAAKTYFAQVTSQAGFNAYQPVFAKVSTLAGFNVTDKFYGWAVNLTTGSVSKFDNFNFNSLSHDLAADTSGIYSMSGDTDNGTAIAAFIETGKMDFGSHQLKRMTDAYIGKNGGICTLTVNAETGSTDYDFAATTQFKTAKQNLARGAKGRYWSVKVANKTGSVAQIDDIELITEELTRKV